MRNPLIIATRGSDLALWQANYIRQRLEALGHAAELKVIRTRGDEIQHISLEKVEGKGFFTKEIEEALLNGEADLAVHSHKDLPTESPAGLAIAAIPSRDDVSELLLIRPDAVDPRLKLRLKRGARTGTSSTRRKTQLRAFRADLVLEDLRGNVPTRVKKLRDGQYDAILIAAAGVERLGLDLDDLHVEKCDPAEFIPAPAQGALAVQIRSGDTALAELLRPIHDPAVATLTEMERKVMALFHGGCHMPLGAHATFDEETGVYALRALRADGADSSPSSVYVESRNPASMAERAFEKLNGISPCQVFISRQRRNDDYLLNVLEGHGFHVTAEPLIEMKPVAFDGIPDTGWIFFSSRHAVNFFFAQRPALGAQKMACIGKSTAEALRKHGKQADFIGYSTDTRLTGKQFAARAGSETVLFPQAKDSLRSVQQGFVKRAQVVDLVVYETLRTTACLSSNPYNILFFTSPSYAEAFLERFKIDPTQKVIAMGEATGHLLKRFGVSGVSFADAFDDTALARAVFTRSSEKSMP